MASTLVERYDDRIGGVLSCYDRVVVTGTPLPTVCYAGGMTRILYANQIRIFDCPDFAVTLRDRVRDQAASLASEAGIAIARATSARRRWSPRCWRWSSRSGACHLGDGVSAQPGRMTDSPCRTARIA
jgi:hypothetical protein